MRHLGLAGLSGLSVIAAIVVLLPATSYATDCYWIHDPNTPGDWSGAGNWDPSTPTLHSVYSSDTAIIDNGGTVCVTGSVFLMRGSLKVGYSYAGSVTQSAESSSLALPGGELWLGYGTGASGTYTLTGGGSHAWQEWVGYGGTGYFTQSGGMNDAGVVYLGRMPGSSGTYVLSGGTLAPSFLTVGSYGDGHVTQTGGIAALDGDLHLGANASATGTYALEGGSLSTAEWMVIGLRGTGGFRQFGGANQIGEFLFLGYWPGARGTYELNGGTMSVGRNAWLGLFEDTEGVFHVNGGSLVTGGSIILAGGWPTCTAELRVSTRAYVQTDGLKINGGENRSTTVIMEVGLRGNSLIHTRGASTLAGVLDVQSLSGFRPKEGQEFTIIACSGTTGPYFSGNFSTITSNITVGLQGLPAFAGAASGSDYVVTFQGLSAGDANGDHAVDGADLGLMGGTWWQTGMGWGDCDFNGDGHVDGGDIALLGGNWNWSLPPAPTVALPEPASAGVLMSAGLALLRRRRRA